MSALTSKPKGQRRLLETLSLGSAIWFRFEDGWFFIHQQKGWTKQNEAQHNFHYALANGSRGIPPLAT